MPNGITKETFSEFQNADKLNVLFDLSIDANKNVEALKNEIATGLTALETKMDKRKMVDTGASIVSGMAGGFLAIAGKWAFWK